MITVFYSPLMRELTLGIVWSCPKKPQDTTQCPLFIWEEDETEAREWLAKHGPKDAPETPSKGNNSTVPKSPETPWTKAKRKPVSREVSDENENGNGGPSNRKVDDGDVFDAGDEGRESPSRKAAKTNEFATPGGQTFTERLKEVALSTTDSGGKGKAIATEPAIPIQAENTSSPPIRSKDALTLSRGGMDLASRVIKLLRDEKVVMKESTELLIRHEIDLDSDLNTAKIRRLEETVSKMSKRIDELETLVSQLTGGDSLDEPIELSD